MLYERPRLFYMHYWATGMEPVSPGGSGRLSQQRTELSLTGPAADRRTAATNDRRDTRPSGGRCALARRRARLRRATLAGPKRSCAGVDSLVSRLGFRVEMDVTATRLPPEVEASVYFVVAEALTNVVKHSQATRAQVTIVVASRTLRVEVRDDGIGRSRRRRSRVARHGRSCGHTPRPAAHRHFARRRDSPGRGAAAGGLEILASIRSREDARHAESIRAAYRRRRSRGGRRRLHGV
jgi:hypothetical protein